MNTVDSVDITVDIILLREAAGGGRYKGGVAALRFSAESFKWPSIIFSQTIRISTLFYVIVGLSTHNYSEQCEQSVEGVSV